MKFVPDFSTAKRLACVAWDNIAEWAEEAEARVEKRASLRSERIERQCAEIQRKHEEELLKHQKKMAETTFTTEEIEYLKAEYKKNLGWTDEQCDEHFADYTIKDKGISTEMQALNQATELNAKLMEQVHQLNQQVHQLQQQLQAALALLAMNK